MIKLNKTPEPSSLRLNKQAWTKSLLFGDEKEKEIVKNKYNNQEIKDALKLETYEKCAYCETKMLDSSFGDIEHILPKSIFPEYAFEWTNLTLVCTKCNNKKRDYYSDSCSILNPYKDCPDDHFYYVGPYLVFKDTRGQVTISKLNLNRLELIKSRGNKLESLSLFINQMFLVEDPEFKKELLEDAFKYAEKMEEYSGLCKVELEKIRSHLTFDSL